LLQARPHRLVIQKNRPSFLDGAATAKAVLRGQGRHSGAEEPAMVQQVTPFPRVAIVQGDVTDDANVPAGLARRHVDPFMGALKRTLAAIEPEDRRPFVIETYALLGERFASEFGYRPNASKRRD
jgi:hypothetical protein